MVYKDHTLGGCRFMTYRFSVKAVPILHREMACSTLLIHGYSVADGDTPEELWARGREDPWFIINLCRATGLELTHKSRSMTGDYADFLQMVEDEIEEEEEWRDS